jgi:hypothetical protein
LQVGGGTQRKINSKRVGAIKIAQFERTGAGDRRGNLEEPYRVKEREQTREKEEEKI